MKSGKTIWVIEQGTYSDYRVIGVFSSRENAQRVVDAFHPNECDPPNIAEWPLDPAVEELNAGCMAYSVVMLRDGSVESVKRSEVKEAINDSPFIWRRSTAAAYLGKGMADCLTATVLATDNRHAVKIVNEKRLQMIAMNQWGAQEA